MHDYHFPSDPKPKRSLLSIWTATTLMASGIAIWQFDLVELPWSGKMNPALVDRTMELKPSKPKPFIVEPQQSLPLDSPPQQAQSFISAPANEHQVELLPAPNHKPDQTVGNQQQTTAESFGHSQAITSQHTAPAGNEEMVKLQALWSSQPTQTSGGIVQTAMVDTEQSNVVNAHFASRSTPQLPAQNHEPQAVIQQLPFRSEGADLQVQTLPYNNNSKEPTRLIESPYFEQESSTASPIQQVSAQKVMTASHSKPVVNPNELTPEQEVQRLRILSTEYWKQPRSVNLDELNHLAHRIYFDKSRHYLTAAVVQPGEMLSNIASRYQVTWQYLAQLNNISPEQLQSGMSLKVMQGPFSAVVDVSDMKLIVHNRGYYVAEYPIGLGTTFQTPMGPMSVTGKQENPDFNSPNGLIDRDDWSNPLGEFLVSLDGNFGIHGTPEADSIGQYSGEGYIRLSSEHIKQVYHLLTSDSSVTIRE